ncbi:MAG: peptide/nickel transport system ATP-binding protein ddpF [Gaiellales bacterium]|nr:peptide/nickel transport system ATP-binding protein ddpF [Gaiellales bacterium]
MCSQYVIISGCVLEVEGLLAVHRGADTVVAANGVTLAIGEQQCVALVGESGSGKTTIARAIIGLHRPEAGTIVFDGERLAGHARDRTAKQRQRIQYVFQNPYDSLSPRQRIADA